ncbi:hypothetical protein BDV39DRAFT_3975 [Aspergillus sergii]|uniref:Uncharacterized protein n=1 Tax=Aspergillus sergii TaxID=1034303 RepID=A0A5N6XFD4_9EURO|nr:hypothetical protein BDV39DRAFT_3975 [Aspergillus sergii]
MSYWLAFGFGFSFFFVCDGIWIVYASSFCRFWLAKFTLEIGVLGTRYSTYVGKIARQRRGAMYRHLLCCIFCWQLLHMSYPISGDWAVMICSTPSQAPFTQAKFDRHVPHPKDVVSYFAAHET